MEVKEEDDGPPEEGGGRVLPGKHPRPGGAGLQVSTGLRLTPQYGRQESRNVTFDWQQLFQLTLCGCNRAYPRSKQHRIT